MVYYHHLSGVFVVLSERCLSECLNDLLHPTNFCWIKGFELEIREIRLSHRLWLIVQDIKPILVTAFVFKESKSNDRFINRAVTDFYPARFVRSALIYSLFHVSWITQTCSLDRKYQNVPFFDRNSSKSNWFNIPWCPFKC